METLLDHKITHQELNQLENYAGYSLDRYEEYTSFFEAISYNQDVCYKEIAQLYDLRGNTAKATEYRAKIKDRSVLKPYVFEDWCGPGKQSDFDPAPESEHQAA